MDRIIWLCLVFAFGVLIIGTVRNNRMGINLKSVHCPSCDTPMSLRRSSRFRSLMLLGKRVCPHCGTRAP
jgi:hypothetical protein